MGRAKLPLKRIPNDKDRKLTFMRRREGLMKKMSEFSTMCGVDATLIVYDGNGDTPPVTWPENPSKVRSMIEKYERQKLEKPIKNFDLEDYFENRKNNIEAEISKVRKDILKIKYPTWDPSLKSLEDEQLRNLIAMLDTKIEACDQRVNMLKNNHQTKANFSFGLNMAPSQSAATNLSQLNSMLNVSQNQLIPAPMMPLNNNSQLASYQPKHDMGSQSQIFDFDTNFMQLMAMNNAMVDSTNQFDVPLDCTKQIGDLEDPANQLGESVDWVSELCEPEELARGDWTTLPGELINGASQLDESVMQTIPSESQNVQPPPLSPTLMR